MRHFTSVYDAADSINALVQSALELKKNPHAFADLGKFKTLGLIFFNASLRTRLSTQRAAQNLGLDCMVMNIGSEGWALETAKGVVMDGNTAEHILEAAPVMGQYCDILGIRAFPGLKNRDEDYADQTIQNFVDHAGVPVVSLESATRHPLQSLADLVTIEELKPAGKRPKVVLTWAPHPRALPQAVPNSFAEWVNHTDAEFVIAHPPGYELHPGFVGEAKVTHNQDEALAGADFVYAKNWSSYTDYGKILSKDPSWTITAKKMALTNNGKFMHCLPVRRNVIVTDEVIDSPNSVVIRQAGNRLWAAQAVLKEILIGLQKSN